LGELCRFRAKWEIERFEKEMEMKMESCWVGGSLKKAGFLKKTGGRPVGLK
jgi:hypothetical protein